VRVRDGRLEARGFLDDEGDGKLTVRDVLASLEHGEWLQCSCATGVSILEYIGEGETAFVNGEIHEGPVAIARNARLDEISIMKDQHAADDGTYVLLGTSYFDSGKMPDRLEILRAVAAAEREIEEATAETDRWLECRRLARAAERERQQIEAADERIREAGLRAVNTIRAVEESTRERSLQAKHALDAPRSIPEEVARQRAIREEQRVDQYGAGLFYSR
jgi:hypothetical protein